MALKASSVEIVNGNFKIPNMEIKEVAVWSIKSAEIIFQQFNTIKVYCLNSNDVIIGCAYDLGKVKEIYKFNH